MDDAGAVFVYDWNGATKEWDRLEVAAPYGVASDKLGYYGVAIDPTNSRLHAVDFQRTRFSFEVSIAEYFNSGG